MGLYGKHIILRIPGTGGPVCEACPLVGVGVHVLEHGAQIGQGAGGRSDADLAQKCRAVIGFEPGGKAAQGSDAVADTEKIRMRARAVGIKILMYFIRKIVGRISDFDHVRGVELDKIYWVLPVGR